MHCNTMAVLYYLAVKTRVVCLHQSIGWRQKSLEPLIGGPTATNQVESRKKGQVETQ